jgi:hypothetical protein
MNQLGVDAFYDFFHRIFHLSAFFTFPRGSVVAAPLVAGGALALCTPP